MDEHTAASSHLQAGRNADVSATGNIVMRSGENRTESSGSNKSRGGSVGVGLTAGRDARFSSGQDLILDGAQASGRSVTADVGRNLWISNRQDSDRYDMKQTGSSAGISGTWGAGVSASRDKMNSNFIFPEIYLSFN